MRMEAEDARKIQKVLSEHSGVVASHLAVLPPDSYKDITESQNVLKKAADELIERSFLEPPLKVDTTNTPQYTNGSGPEHRIAYTISLAMGKQLQFFKDPAHRLPAASRIALLKSLQSVAEALDDVGVFVTQSEVAWNSLAMPKDVEMPAKMPAEDEVVERRTKQHYTEGLKPSSFGFFKMLRVTLEQLNSEIGRR